MFRNIRKMLVSSYVGAIALGYLLSECILHFSAIFSAPIARWIGQDEYRALTTNASYTGTNPLRYALPEFARFVILGLVWYVLFRWLYSGPLKDEMVETPAVAD